MNDDMTQKAKSPGSRNYLWYVAFLLVLPAWLYGLAKGTLPLVLLGLPVFLMLIYLSLSKLVCPECGKAMRTVGAKLASCPYCGARYNDKL